MQLSYLLIFAYVLIFFLGLLTSANHVLKSAVCCLVSGGLVAIYLYFERSFANLTSFRSMRSYFYYRLERFFLTRGISAHDGDLVASGIYILILFAAIFIIMYVILTLFAFGDAPRKDKKIWKKKAICLVFYYSLWAFVITFIVSMASPAFNSFEVGFLSPLINSLKWEVVK